MSPRSPSATAGVESFSLNLPEVGWCNLVCVDDSANGSWFLFYWRLMLLWMMGVGFENICSFRENKCLQGYLKTIKIGI